MASPDEEHDGAFAVPASPTIELSVSESELVRRARPQFAYLTVLTGPAMGAVHKLKDVAVVGRSADVELRIEDDGVSRRHVRIVRNDGNQTVLRDLDSRNGVFVNGHRTTHRVLQDGDRIQLGSSTVIKFAFQDEFEEQYQRTLLDNAIKDSLTDLFNKRYFGEQLEAEMAFCQRHGTIISLLMLDVDHFKRVNDTHGHLTGDAVLRQIAELVQMVVRIEDVVARVGGEEFAIILRGTGAKEAFLVSERVREVIKAHQFRIGPKTLKVTVSCGVATMTDSSATSEQLLSTADDALYEAKSGGRDCSVASTI